MSHGLPALWPLMLAAAPILADADEGGRSRTALRFEVRLTRKTAPRDGRVIVVLGGKGREPRFLLGATGLAAAPAIARDVKQFETGSVAVLDDSCTTSPIESLDRLPAGTYFAQAVLRANRDLLVTNAPGDLYGPVVKVKLDPARGGAVSLELSSEVDADADSAPAETDLIKFVKLESKVLSAFHGRPMFLRAGVILPRDFGEDADRRYPLRVHIGGYGARYTGVKERMREGSESRAAWMADDAPRMILLMLDGAGPLGDPYQVNSANNGPYGDAVTKELIPFVEARYRGDGKSRVLDGGSTGGWVALALQVFYPDTFDGCWASCPDGVDFRDFQLVNIYESKNAYVNEDGFERPGARTLNGDVKYTMRHELRMENLLGAGDSWTKSGGQWGAWNATYGPRGADGPKPLWDPKTGEIDRAVVDHWKTYDLRMILERDWATLGPKLKGKIHIFVGESDDYFLNNAVHRLDAFLAKADPPFAGVIRFGPGKGHCWSPLDEVELMKQMGEAARAKP